MDSPRLPRRRKKRSERPKSSQTIKTTEETTDDLDSTGVPAPSTQSMDTYDGGKKKKKRKKGSRKKQSDGQGQTNPVVVIVIIAILAGGAFFMSQQSGDTAVDLGTDPNAAISPAPVQPNAAPVQPQANQNPPARKPIVLNNKPAQKTINVTPKVTIKPSMNPGPAMMAGSVKVHLKSNLPGVTYVIHNKMPMPPGAGLPPGLNNFNNELNPPKKPETPEEPKKNPVDQAIKSFFSFAASQAGSGKMTGGEPGILFDSHRRYEIPDEKPGIQIVTSIPGEPFHEFDLMMPGDYTITAYLDGYKTKEVPFQPMMQMGKSEAKITQVVQVDFSPADIELIRQSACCMVQAKDSTAYTGFLFRNRKTVVTTVHALTSPTSMNLISFSIRVSRIRL